MTTTISHTPTIRWATPSLTRATETLLPAGERLWRVLDARGSIRGHLRILPHDLGLRYRAERLHLGSESFRVVGDFWSPDDAVAALRY